MECLPADDERVEGRRRLDRGALSPLQGLRFSPRHRARHRESGGVFGGDERSVREAYRRARESFNALDAAGFEPTLVRTSRRLDVANKVAGQITNAWEFAERSDPRKGQDDPTHGLKPIGDILSEGVGKMKAVALAGPILAHFVAYDAEAAKAFATGLSKLKTRIRIVTRQNTLCGQSGVWKDAQAAFEPAMARTGVASDCRWFQLTGTLPRLRKQVFEDEHGYFSIFDPSSQRRDPGRA